jgi:hypothetical protein
MIRRIGLIMAPLALLPFFQWYRGTPHQDAAIKELEDSIPLDLLQEDAAWFEAWKESGIAQRAYVPYFSQLDDESGEGYRMCLTAAAAMVAATMGKVNTYAEYKKVREKFGDTTLVKAHLDALKSLGLNAEFRTDADDALVEAEIASGRPVLVGWLHHGDLTLGEPPQCSSWACGHWSVVTGYEGIRSANSNWVMHDPMGLPNIELGGHARRHGGKNIKVPRAAFRRRWQVEGPATGWVILVDDE